MRRILVLVAVAASSGAATVNAAGLDAPVENKPTVRTEIVRGVSAANRCDARATAMLSYSKCIFDTYDANRQKISAPESFSVGLFFNAWLQANAVVEAANSSNNSMSSDISATASRISSSFYSVFTDQQRKVGLSDDEVIEASGMKASVVRSKLETFRQGSGR